MNLYNIFVKENLLDMYQQNEDIVSGTKTTLSIYLEKLNKINISIHDKITEHADTIADNKNSSFKTSINLLSCSDLTLPIVPDNIELTNHDKIQIAFICSKIIKQLNSNIDFLFTPYSVLGAADALKDFHFNTIKDLCNNSDLGKFIFTKGPYAVAKDFVSIIEQMGADEQNQKGSTIDSSIVNKIAEMVVYNDLLEMTGCYAQENISES